MRRVTRRYQCDGPKRTVRYYAKVALDGDHGSVELASATALDDTAWLAKAATYQTSIEAAEAAQIEMECEDGEIV